MFHLGRFRPTRWLAFVLAFGAVSPAFAQKKNPDGAPILLLSGGQREHHGYRDQAFYLSRMLEDTGRYRVTIAEDASILTSGTLDRFAAVILLTDRRDPEFKFTEAQQRGLVEYVRSPGHHGLVTIHGADNAAPDWIPEMRDMLGGVFSHDTSGGRPDGKTRKGSYRVHLTQPAHPVCEGLADFDIDDELYYHLQLEPGVEPIATIALEGTDWPVAWTRAFGGGRVFHCTLGHRDFAPGSADPLQNPDLGRFVLQGLDWTVLPWREAAAAPESQK